MPTCMYFFYGIADQQSVVMVRRIHYKWPLLFSKTVGKTAEQMSVRAIFYFNLPSHNHIHIAKYFFSIRNEKYKNLGDNTVLACEIFSSSCRPRLKNARA